MITIIVRLSKNLTPAEYAFVIESKNELNQRKMKNFSLSFFGLSISAHIAGVRVSATNPEITTDVAMVIANCLYSSPVSPPRNAIGINTEESTVLLNTGAVTLPLL